MTKREPEEIAVLQQAIAGLGLVASTTPETFGYRNVVLCCIDAVLSINRPYLRFVVPRIRMFREQYGDDLRLEQVLSRINGLGVAEFGMRVLKYRHADRIRVLRDLCDRLNGISSEAAAFDEFTCIHDWLAKQGVGGLDALHVRGIGLATYQYLRMLMGIDTIKPDIHISRFICEAVGRRVPQRRQIDLLEAVSRRLGFSAIALDHAIWRRSAIKSVEE